MNKLYDEFWSIYNPEFCDFGNKFKYRLENRQYKNTTLKKLIKTINWFNENYDTDNTFFYFRFDQFKPSENPDIAVRRKSDKYDLGTFKLIKGKIQMIYEPEN